MADDLAVAESPDLQEIMRRLSQTSASTSAPAALKAEAEFHERYEAKRQALLAGHIKQEEELLAKLQAANVSMDEGFMASWTQELGDLKHHFEAHDLQGVADSLKNSSSVPELSAKQEQGGAVVSAAPAGKPKALGSLMDQIDQLHKELCDKPGHATLKNCVEFRARAAAKMHADHAAMRERIAKELPMQVATLESGLALIAQERKRSVQQIGHEALRSLCADPYHSNRPECLELAPAHQLQKHSAELQSQLAANAKDHAAWEHEFAEKARQAQRELCSDPARRESKPCKQFLATSAGQASETLEARLAAAGDDSAAWSHTFKVALRESQREMCAEPHRSGREDCVKLLASIAEAERAEAANNTPSSTSALLLVDSMSDDSTWKHAFMAAVQQTQREMCAEPHRRGRADCVELMNSIAKTGGAPPQADAKAPAVPSNLLQTIRQTQKEMCSEPHRRQRADCIELMATLAKAEHAEARAARAEHRKHDYEELQAHTAALETGLEAIAADHAAWEHKFAEKANSIHRELCMEPQRRNRKDCVEFLASASGPAVAQTNESTSDDSAAWSHEFMRSVRKAQREMCQEPHRRGRADCVELLTNIEQVELQEAEARKQALAHGAELRANITVESAVRSAALDQSASERAAKQKQWEQELLERYGLPAAGSKDQSTESPGVTTAAEERTSLRQGRRQLHWSEVAGWSSKGWLQRSLASKGAVLVERPDLTAARWAGMIPKVACVVAVPSGIQARSQLKYVINSFHQQTYEGPTQLILVYDYKDEEAAKQVQMYADGSHIKGVASRDEGIFPSTTSLRFGAWSAGEDAKVVAQWEWDAWHHPQRLSLQVRALAYSSRPASVLTERDGAGDAVKEDTLIGEAKWMQQHWHPLLDEQHAVLQGLQTEHVVQVHMDATPESARNGVDPFASIRPSMDKHFEKLIELLGKPQPAQ